MTSTAIQAAATRLNTLIGRTVRDLLKDHGYTGSDLALWLGVTKMQASRRLNGKTGFTPVDLYIVGREMGLPMDAFFTRVNDPYEMRFAELEEQLMQERAAALGHDPSEVRPEGLEPPTFCFGATPFAGQIALFSALIVPVLAAARRA